MCLTCSYATSLGTTSSQRHFWCISTCTGGPRTKWSPVAASLRALADATGLSKSAVHAALESLRRRELIATKSLHATATPTHRVLRHWRAGTPERKLQPHEK